jgi:hypothetical protein
VIWEKKYIINENELLLFCIKYYANISTVSVKEKDEAAIFFMLIRNNCCVMIVKINEFYIIYMYVDFRWPIRYFEINMTILLYLFICDSVSIFFIFIDKDNCEKHKWTCNVRTNWEQSNYGTLAPHLSADVYKTPKYQFFSFLSLDIYFQKLKGVRVIS